jgi:hypothetical protein
VEEHEGATAERCIHGRYLGTHRRVDRIPMPVRKMAEVHANAVSPTTLVLQALIGAHTTVTQEAT